MYGEREKEKTQWPLKLTFLQVLFIFDFLLSQPFGYFIVFAADSV